MIAVFYEWSWHATCEGVALVAVDEAASGGWVALGGAVATLLPESRTPFLWPVALPGGEGVPIELDVVRPDAEARPQVSSFRLDPRFGLDAPDAAERSFRLVIHHPRATTVAHAVAGVAELAEAVKAGRPPDAVALVAPVRETPRPVVGPAVPLDRALAPDIEVERRLMALDDGDPVFAAPGGGFVWPALALRPAAGVTPERLGESVSVVHLPYARRDRPAVWTIDALLERDDGPSTLAGPVGAASPAYRDWTRIADWPVAGDRGPRTRSVARGGDPQRPAGRGTPRAGWHGVPRARWHEIPRARWRDGRLVIDSPAIGLRDRFGLVLGDGLRARWAGEGLGTGECLVFEYRRPDAGDRAGLRPVDAGDPALDAVRPGPAITGSAVRALAREILRGRDERLDALAATDALGRLDLLSACRAVGAPSPGLPSRPSGVGPDLLVSLAVGLDGVDPEAAKALSGGLDGARRAALIAARLREAVDLSALVAADLLVDAVPAAPSPSQRGVLRHRCLPLAPAFGLGGPGRRLSVILDEAETAVRRLDAIDEAVRGAEAVLRDAGLAEETPSDLLRAVRGWRDASGVRLAPGEAGAPLMPEDLRAYAVARCAEAESERDRRLRRWLDRLLDRGDWRYPPAPADTTPPPEWTALDRRLRQFEAACRRHEPRPTGPGGRPGAGTPPGASRPLALDWPPPLRARFDAACAAFEAASRAVAPDVAAVDAARPNASPLDHRRRVVAALGEWFCHWAVWREVNRRAEAWAEAHRDEPADDAAWRAWRRFMACREGPPAHWPGLAAELSAVLDLAGVAPFPPCRPERLPAAVPALSARAANG